MPAPVGPPGYWSAILRAAERLGIAPVFLRVVAAELPDEPWLSDLILLERGDAVVARLPHLCDPACPLTADACLTAFKVEAEVARRKGLPFFIDALEPRDGDVEVRLRPYP